LSGVEGDVEPGPSRAARGIAALLGRGEAPPEHDDAPSDLWRSGHDADLGVAIGGKGLVLHTDLLEGEVQP
jgi:hypothetical protein